MDKEDGFTHSELMTGYDPQRAAVEHALVADEKIADYYQEKLLGKRLPNGVKPLKKLNGRHQRIIALHLTGKFSGVRIGEMLECSAFTVHRTLNDPIAQKIINDFHSSIEMDLKAMLPLAIEAVRDGLEHEDPDVRLRAVGRLESMTGRADEKEREGGINVNISFIQNTREKFFKELSEAAGDSFPRLVENESKSLVVEQAE